MNIITRKIQEILEKSLFKGKIMVIYGARQVGKTTLIKEIQKKYPEKSIYLNCDEANVSQTFDNATSAKIKQFFGDNKLVLLDEAQRVLNIGLALKLMIDNYPEVQIIATGSSSFDLSNKTKEPLTGRKLEFHLYPLAVEEIAKNQPAWEIDRILEERLIFGMYPEIYKQDRLNAVKLLKNLTGDYLYKDALEYQDIRRPEAITKLLQALALQIGNEVSYNELASITGLNAKTVAAYIQILEQAFVIFRLRPYSRNLRKELGKLRKIYFWDNGVRNALINNFNELSLRQDVGSLWENFLISERMKFNENNERLVNVFFWRTHQKQEIDFLEESGGVLAAFEFKWRKEKVKPPKIFTDAYPQSQLKIINKENVLEFLT
jgi:predicted AAA+ superfamily ATPase